MLHEADNQEQYGHWSWDTETLARANGLQHVLTSFDFLMSLTTTANALASLRPLSIKLQRRSWDIVKAYKLVTATVEDLERVRGNEEIMDEWFHQASTLAQSVDTEPRVPRTTGRQHHHSNVEHSSQAEYFRRTITIPFLDHLICDMKERFSATSQQAASLLCLSLKCYERHQ